MTDREITNSFSRDSSPASDTPSGFDAGDRNVPSTDDALLGNWRHLGDEGAFEELFRRHAGMVRRTCVRCGAMDPDEATQAVFLVLADRSKTRPLGSQLGGWLVLTARNVSSVQRRGIARRKRHEGEAARHLEAERNSAPSGSLDLLPVLDQALTILTPARREAIVRFFLQGKSQETVARELGCSIGAVKVRIHEGLEKLRSQIPLNKMAMSGALLAGILSAEAKAAESAPGVAFPGTVASGTGAAALAKASAASGMLTWVAVASAAIAIGITGAVAAGSSVDTRSAVSVSPSPSIEAASVKRSLSPEEAMQQWRSARIGLAVEWGLKREARRRWPDRPLPFGIQAAQTNSSGPPVSITDYQQLSHEFRGEAFDARELVSLARGNGFRYLTLVAKDGDGFTLYDSATTTFSTVRASPFGRDAVAEVLQESRRQGIMAGVEFSLRDDASMQHPAGRFAPIPGSGWTGKYVQDVCRPQVRELMDRYPIAIFASYTASVAALGERGYQDVRADIAARNPGCLKNTVLYAKDLSGAKTGLIDPGPGTFFSYEHESAADGPLASPAESIIGLQPSMGRNPTDQTWFPLSRLVRDLVTVISRGENCRIRIVLETSGAMDPLGRQRLEALGQWLHRNGEAVYEAQPSSFSPASGPGTTPRWISTRKGRHVYLTFPDGVSAGALTLPARKEQAVTARILGGPSVPSPRRINDHDVVDLPAIPSDLKAPVLALEYSTPLGE